MPNNDFTLSSIGRRGLVIFDDEDSEYHYVTESAWRARGALQNVPAEVPVNQLVNLNVVVAELADGAFVDLERLPELEAPSVAGNGATAAWVPDVKSIVLREGERVYQVPETEWQLVPEGFEGDAGVLVKRGTVVASIPSNSIPSGTYCVLVNLANL